MMATAIQENGMKLLTNGSTNMHDLESTTVIKDEPGLYQVRSQFPESLAVEEESPAEHADEIDIFINNVVCTFSVRCHLNLREIALNGCNVEYKRENGVINMKLKKPSATATIRSSGKITCAGAKTEADAKIAARRFARCLQKLGFKARFYNYRVVNVLGSCSMPFAIKINTFSNHHKKNASYEPELHPSVTYRLKEPKATLKIFSTGSITVLASNVMLVELAIKHIYPLVYEFRTEKVSNDLTLSTKKKGRYIKQEDENKSMDCLMIKNEASDEEPMDSDASWD